MTDVRTRRLRLVPITPYLLGLLDDPAAFATAAGVATAPGFPDADLSDLLALHGRRLATDPDDPEFGPWLVIDHARRVLVGSTGFHGRPAADRTIEIGFGIAPSERCKGYATESAAELTAWALAREEVTRVVARGVLTGNAASLRVLERLGYRRTRTGDGTVDWEITV